jgi:hypothetical protein
MPPLIEACPNCDSDSYVSDFNDVTCEGCLVDGCEDCIPDGLCEDCDNENPLWEERQ